MVDEQIIKIALQLAGQEKADQLIKAFGLVDANAKKAATAVSVLDTSTYELADSFENLGSDLTDANRAMDRMVAEAVEATRTQRLLAGMLNETGTAAAALGVKVESLAEKKKRLAREQAAVNSRVLEFGRAFQDISQGGLGGGINNIERLVGGAGKAAGVLTVLGTVAYAFQGQIYEAAKAAGVFGDKMRDSTIPMAERLAERIKELESKPVKLAVDATELEAAKKRLAELEVGLAEFRRSQRETVGAEAKEAGKAIAEQINEAEGGRAGVSSDLKASLARELADRDLGLKAARQNLASSTASAEELRKAPGDNTTALARQARLTEQYEEQIRESLRGVQAMAETMAGNLLVNAESGTDAGREQLSGQLKAAGRGRLGTAVGGLTVEAFRDDERVQRELDESIAGMKASQAAARERKKAEEKKKAETAAASKDKAESEKEAEAKAARDRKDLEAGLGADFIAGAEVERLGVEAVPPWQRGKARKAYQDQVQRAANQKLIENGVDPGRAAELAGQTVGYVNEDLNAKSRAAAAAGFTEGPQRTAAILDQIRGVGRSGEMGLTNQDMLIEATTGLANVGAGLIAGQAKHAAQIENIGQFVKGMARNLEGINRDIQPRRPTLLRRRP